MAPDVFDGHVICDVTWPEWSGSWHQYAGADYLENGWRYTLSYDFTWLYRSRSSRHIWTEIPWKVLEVALDRLRVLWTLSCFVTVALKATVLIICILWKTHRQSCRKDRGNMNFYYRRFTWNIRKCISLPERSSTICDWLLTFPYPYTRI